MKYLNRRNFLGYSAAGSGLMLTGADNLGAQRAATEAAAVVDTQGAVQQPTMIGSYGQWAAGIIGDGPARLSYRNDRFRDVAAWRKEAKVRVQQCLLAPDIAKITDVRVHERFTVEGLHGELLSWQLPYGPRTEAVFLKPEGATGRLPAVLALHDHGGNKYFGTEKITRTNRRIHPMMLEHQKRSYGGVAWANELAKRGYAVLVHDTFTFASRRVLWEDVPDTIKQSDRFKNLKHGSAEYIRAYNR